MKVKTFDSDLFYSQLSGLQRIEVTTKCSAEMLENVVPYLEKITDGFVDMEYTHFMILEQSRPSPRFISISVVYRQLKPGAIKRETIRIREYEHEHEMNFYMALQEYENVDDPNPVLFN